MKKSFRIPIMSMLIQRMGTLLLCLLLTSITAWGQNIKTTKISIDLQNVSMKEALKAIEGKTDFTFFNSDGAIDANRKVNVQANNENLSDVLQTLLADYTYSQEGKRIMLTQKAAGKQQTPQTVTGKVVDAMGAPMPVVNVLIKGTTQGVLSANDGTYSINIPASVKNPVLLYSFIGFGDKEETVGSRSVVNVSLNEELSNLDEVVVTALGIKREEKSLGYAVQSVDGNSLTTVKTAEVSSALTGKIAGMNVKNTTEFNGAPSILLRGESPLLVVDGVPFANISLRDIATDDIESINVLKGATAAALYGSKGENGAIMITTKKGNKEGGVEVSINSSSLFSAGFLALPKVQSSYSSGSGGHFTGADGDYVWGDKLDIGRTASQYNPFTYEWEESPLVSKGKNNLKNFLQTSYVLNNNISISQQGEHGSFRTSLTYVYNRGQYPNNKLNKITGTVSGDMKLGNFELEGGMSYNKRIYPNDHGSGYGNGYIYNLLLWTGPEYDVRDYKNYWVSGQENVMQNWMDHTWYDNPYFMANEIIHQQDYNITNGYFSGSYKITPWLKAMVRSGLDVYADKQEWRNPLNTNGGWYKNGYFYKDIRQGFSANSDAFLMVEHKLGKIGIDGFVGGNMYYYEYDKVIGETASGLLVPGYYSLKASVDPARVESNKEGKRSNSVYGKLTLSYGSSVFVDFTGRNDWSSTLPKETRSYFYPSVATSVIVSDFFRKPQWMDLLKVRGSWTMTKRDLGIYKTNNVYNIQSDRWSGLSSATYPSTIMGVNLKPESSKSYETGISSHLIKNRIWFDVTYYNKLSYDFAVPASISGASGFSGTYINSKEEIVRKGLEVSVGSSIIKTNQFTWEVLLNWARDRRFYNKIDMEYSAKNPWIYEGARYDVVTLYDWERDSKGNIINQAGLPSISNYKSLGGYYDPDWIWGITNTLKYKNFTLAMSVDGRVGGYAFSRTNQAMWHSGAHELSDNEWRYEEVVNGNKTYVGQGVELVSGSVDRDAYGNIIQGTDTRVFKENSQVVSYETYTKRYHAQVGSPRIQNYFDQTYLKLREVSLTYVIPKEVSKKAGIKGCNVSIIGQNMLLWTKEMKYADPDKGTQTEDVNSPSMRYLGANIKINF